MEIILVKIFATALALSEVTTQPQAVKSHFDAVADQDEVVQTQRRAIRQADRRYGGERDQRIESFLADFLALAGEDLDAIRIGCGHRFWTCSPMWRRLKTSYPKP
jgi:penicillin-binding protein 1A